MEKDHVFIGDVHGDNDALLNSLAASGLIKKRRRWSKNSTLHRKKDAKLVLVGDLVDRGCQNMKVLETVEAMREEWKEDLVVLLGNHDLMWRKALENSDNQYAVSEWMLNDGKTFLEEVATSHHISKLRRATRDYPFETDQLNSNMQKILREKWASFLQKKCQLVSIDFPAALEAMRKYYLESSAYKSLWEHTVLAYQPCPEVIAVHASVEANHQLKPNNYEIVGGKAQKVPDESYAERMQAWAKESIACMGVEAANNVFTLCKHLFSFLVESSCIYGAVWNRHVNTQNISSASIDYLQQRGVQMIVHGHTPNFQENVRFDTHPSGIHLLCVDNAMSSGFPNSATQWSYALLTKQGELSMETNCIPQTVLGDFENGRFLATDIDSTDVKR